MEIISGDVRRLVGVEWAGAGPAERQETVVFQLVVATEKTRGHRALNVQVELFIDLHLVLPCDRLTCVLLKVPEIVWLVMLRNRLVARLRITKTRGLRAVFVDVEEL